MLKMMITAIALLALLAGCSAKSSFYQLHPKARGNAEVKTRQKDIVIGIAEVEVPEYLNKPEMVTRLSAGRVSIHQEERWAGSFPENLQSVLRQNLDSMMPRYTFLSSPWEEPVSDDCRIYLSIDRFDGDAAGLVTLEGRWSLVDRNASRVLYSETIHDTLQGGTSLDAIVGTQSSLLYRLSRQIAKKMRSKIR